MRNLAAWSFLFATLAVVGCDCGGTGADDPDGNFVIGPDGGIIWLDDGGWVLTDAGYVIGPDGGIIWLTDGGTGDGGWGTDNLFNPVACQSHFYLCGNGIDDDGDGRTDWADPDCLGPCDNNESGFSTEIPGGHAPGCGRECYFDQDNGPGNDNCYWSTACDPLEPEAPEDLRCEYDPNQLGSKDCPVDANDASDQSAMCLDVCKPLVPNGCDCFGCCELPSGSGEFVFIGTGVEIGVPSCTLEALAAPDGLDRCRPCTPVEDCAQGCGRCQLCIGKTTVPDDCFVVPGDPGGGYGDGGYTITDGGMVIGPDGGIVTGPDGGPIIIGPGDGGAAGDGGTVPVNPDQCPGGEQACGLPGQAACPAGFYCLTGCCRFIE